MLQKDYPEVYIAEELKPLLSAFPKVECGVKPICPKEPVKPSEPVKETGCGGYALFLIGLAIMCGKIGAQKADGTLYFLMIVCGIASVFFIYCYFSFESSYEKEVKDYQRNILDYNINYQDFLKKKEEYEKELYEYTKRENEALKESHKWQNFTTYRKELLKKYIDTKSRPELYISKDEVLEGPAEERFFNLCEEYGLFVYRKRSTHADDKLYYPDIVWDADGLYFDIEIDEPYTLSEGTPIHYVDKYGKSIDSERNMAFIQSKWSVIRFSEEQICKHPCECVCYMLSIIGSIKRGLFNAETYPYYLLQTKKWNQEQSHKWAYQHYREVYLPQIDKLPQIKNNIINTRHSDYVTLSEGYDELQEWYLDEDLESDDSAIAQVDENAVSSCSLRDFYNKYGKIYTRDYKNHCAILSINSKGEETFLSIPKQEEAWKLPGFPDDSEQIIKYLNTHKNEMIVCDYYNDKGNFYHLLCRSDCYKELSGLLYLKGKNGLIPQFNVPGLKPILQIRPNTLFIEDNVFVDYYDYNPFLDNYSVTEIVLNPEIKSIGVASFAGLKKLKHINMPHGLLEIKHLAFWGCSELSSIAIPGSVNKVPEYAFADCVGLGSIDLQEGILSIEEYAFDNCKSLRELDIPKSVISFRLNSISGCTNLRQLNIKNPYMRIVVDQLEDSTWLLSTLKIVSVPAGSTNYFSNYFKTEIIRDTDDEEIVDFD